MLWPEAYDFTSLLDRADDQRWWDKVGNDYRAGGSGRTELIAAAAVLRSRIPEEAVTNFAVYDYGHSVADQELEALARMLGCCLRVHVRTRELPDHVQTLGSTSAFSSTVAMMFADRGGGHV